jgi:hypothetical protein
MIPIRAGGPARGLRVVERRSEHVRDWVARKIEWVEATRAGRKWAELTPRSQRILVTAGAAGLALIMVAGLVLGVESGSPATRTSESPGPRVAEATESQSGSASPVDSALPPAPSASENQTSYGDPSILASVGCAANRATASAGGRLYVACGFGAAATVVAIDLATDVVARTYEISRPNPPCQGACRPLVPEALMVHGGLWIEWSDSVVQRFDLNSGKVTSQVSDIHLVGDIWGSIWVETASDLTAVSPDGPLPQSNPASEVSWTDIRVACGSIWAVSGSTGAVSFFDTVTHGWRVAVVTGGYVYQVLELGSTCWIVRSSSGGKWQLTRFQGGCLGDQAITVDALPFQLGDNTWIQTQDGLYRIDLTSGVKYGPAWLLPTRGSYDTVAWASGQVWAANGDQFARLAIPPNPAPNQATMAPLACAIPSPSPSPSPSVTPTASATPSPSVTPAVGATPAATSTAAPTGEPTSTPTSPSTSPSPSSAS